MSNIPNEGEGPITHIPINRVITISKLAYAELSQELLPSERWYDPNNKGLVLFVTRDWWSVERIVVRAK